MNTCSALRLAIHKIDWALLRQQKSELLALPVENEALIEGLASLIDAIQDAVVADGLVTNMTVFGKDAEE